MKKQISQPKAKEGRNPHSSSFRDPSGFIFFDKGKLFRKINPVYQENYRLLMDSGLYDELISNGLMVSHKEVSDGVIEPEFIPFISYPYEWSFSQLKDAALLTLRVQKIAISHEMSLKDATSFNVQFYKGKVVFIDTLSFEKFDSSKPWVAYKQFCEQFLAPLALTSYIDARLNELLIPYINGVPLDLAAKLLPIKARVNPGVLMHVVFHSGNQKKHSDTRNVKQKQIKFNKNSALGIIDSLENTIKHLKWDFGKTTWSGYGADNYFESYEEKTLAKKKEVVANFLDIVKPKTAWDLGANTGNYSRIAAGKKISTVSADFDLAAVEQAYVWVREHKEENILPLYLDLANPTPAIGFFNEERESFFKRQQPDVVMALALIHHLAIGANLPLPKLASFFNDIAKNLIIEFVPKDDPQTQRLLVSREDVFPNYTEKDFEIEFGKYFKVKKQVALPNSKRTLYLMERK